MALIPVYSNRHLKTNSGVAVHGYLYISVRMKRCAQIMELTRHLPFLPLTECDCVFLRQSL